MKVFGNILFPVVKEVQADCYGLGEDKNNATWYEGLYNKLRISLE